MELLVISNDHILQSEICMQYIPIQVKNKKIKKTILICVNINTV